MTTLVRWLHACGIAPRSTLRRAARLPAYLRDYRALKRSVDGDRWNVMLSHPCLADHNEPGGTASGHYFHQDLFVAQRVFARQPKRHCDVGSRVDGFVAHVASFRPIDYIDLRPMAGHVQNIAFKTGDLLDPSTLPHAEYDSVSALHVIEHAGLGRYGDRVDANGWAIAFESLRRMLVPSGVLYVSVPIGRERIEFNAHRVFSPRTIIGAAANLGLTLESFAWIDDQGGFHPPGDKVPSIPSELDSLVYGCGICEFRLSGIPA